MTQDQQAALEQVARELRENIMKNMEGRRGFRRDSVDDETKAEWDAEWDALIMPVLAAQRAKAMEEAAAYWAHRSAMTDNWSWAQCCDKFVEWLKKQAQEQRP